MPVPVHIPSALRCECGGARELSVEGDTVRKLLLQIETDHPALFRSVCDETGAVRTHINLFVGDSIVDKQHRIDSALREGDCLYIMTAVSGG